MHLSVSQFGDGGHGGEGPDNPSYPSMFLEGYVDNTFMPLPKDLVDPFWNHLNKIEPSINFTVEKKKDGWLAFLGVQLCREDDGTMSTTATSS